MTHQVILQDSIYTPLDSHSPSHEVPFQQQRSLSPNCGLISSISSGQRHFTQLSLNHNSRSNCASMVKKRKTIQQPETLDLMESAAISNPRKKDRIQARRESSKIESIIRQQTIDDKLKPTSFNLEYILSSTKSHRRLLSIPKPYEQNRFTTNIINCQNSIAIKQGLPVRPHSRLPPIAKSHHKAITQQLLSIPKATYNRSGSTVLHERLGMDADGFPKTVLNPRDMQTLCKSSQGAKLNTETRKLDEQKNLQILQKVSKLQMQSSGSLKNLKEIDQNWDNVDLKHVKLNVSNLKTHREKSSKSKKEEQKFKRRFPIIQIRGKIKTSLNVKLSHQANIPKFLLQQKQMSKNLAFQSPSSSSKIRNFIKGFSSVLDGVQPRERPLKLEEVTNTNPLVGSALQTPVASPQKRIQFGSAEQGEQK